MIFFWKCQEVVFHTTRANLYNNCHSLVAKLLDILLLIKYIIEDPFFYKQFSWIGLQTNLQQLAFPNLFADSTTYLATDLKLDRYIYIVCENSDNYKPDNEMTTSNKKNDEEI